MYIDCLVIPESIRYIKESAFEECSGIIGSLEFFNPKVQIGVSALRGCSGFSGTRTLPNSINAIEDYDFYGCKSFTGLLTIPNSVNSIGASAFFGCIGFSELYYIGTYSASYDDFKVFMRKLLNIFFFYEYQIKLFHFQTIVLKKRESFISK